MNGTKSMVGHCLGAAAGIEAVAVLKAIETGALLLCGLLLLCV